MGVAKNTPLESEDEEVVLQLMETNDFVSVVREGPKVPVPVEHIVMKISTAAGTFITTLVGVAK